jgi:hypothetical protein
MPNYDDKEVEDEDAYGRVCDLGCCGGKSKRFHVGDLRVGPLLCAVPVDGLLHHSGRGQQYGDHRRGHVRVKMGIL